MKAVFKSTTGVNKNPFKEFIEKYASGDVIFEEGDLGTEMYIIQSGQIEIRKKFHNTHKVLGVLEKGDFFGEMAILEDLPRNAAAYAKSDVELVKINGATFDMMLRNNTEIAVRMLRKFSRRLREADALLAEAFVERVEGPIAAPPAEPATRQAKEIFSRDRLIEPKMGQELPLSNGLETTIGRRDPVTGINPDIDLTALDTNRSVSRRHAKIYRRAEKYFLVEEIGTMNGTFVNDQRLATGTPMEIKDGDRLRIGLVDLDFKAAS